MDCSPISTVNTLDRSATRSIGSKTRSSTSSSKSSKKSSTTNGFFLGKTKSKREDRKKRQERRKEREAWFHKQLKNATWNESAQEDETTVESIDEDLNMSYKDEGYTKPAIECDSNETNLDKNQGKCFFFSIL